VPFPEPTEPAGSRAEVLLRYLDYFRSRLAAKLAPLPAAGLRRTALPSGWTPLELAKHLRYAGLRWPEWGFAGRHFDDPWDQAAGTRAIVGSHDLSDVGAPAIRWHGARPATLERVLLHLLQEYARHLGQLDVVVELATGSTGE
jgi:hypothetical protein